MKSLPLMILISSISLSACSALTSTRMPTGGESMATVYAQAINGTDESSINAIRASVNHAAQAVNYSAYTATQQQAIENLFPRMKNPTLVMYVYPHVVGEGNTQVPVPGYSTVFALYNGVYFL